MVVRNSEEDLHVYKPVFKDHLTSGSMLVMYCCLPFLGYFTYKTMRECHQDVNKWLRARAEPIANAFVTRLVLRPEGANMIKNNHLPVCIVPYEEDGTIMVS
jgi:hypothetical protein